MDFLSYQLVEHCTAFESRSGLIFFSGFLFASTSVAYRTAVVTIHYSFMFNFV